MSDLGKKSPGARAGATGAGLPTIEAAGSQNIRKSKPQRQPICFQIFPDDGSPSFVIKTDLIEGWVLEQLMEAGSDGLSAGSLMPEQQRLFHRQFRRLEAKGVIITTRFVLRARVTKGGAE